MAVTEYLIDQVSFTGFFFERCCYQILFYRGGISLFVIVFPVLDAQIATHVVTIARTNLTLRRVVLNGRCRHCLAGILLLDNQRVECAAITGPGIIGIVEAIILIGLGSEPGNELITKKTKFVQAL